MTTIDATEFTELVDRQRDKAIAAAYVIVRKADMATDVVADAVALAWRHRGQFREDGPIEAWFMRIVRNRARERCRWSDRRPAHQLDDQISLWLRDTRDNAERELLTRERAACVHRTVKRIPPFLRTPIQLVYLDGVPCAAAAQQLGIPCKTFKSRLHRGARMFREMWREAA